MNQQECKDLAIKHVELSNKVFSLDEQRNMIMAAQVYATLATIPEEIVYNPNEKYFT